MKSFTQIRIHVVIITKQRKNSIPPEFRQRLYEYSSKILSTRGHKCLAINGTENHIHILLDYKPKESLSDLLREFKKSTNAFINTESSNKHFQWQSGFGAFSVSRQHIDRVCRYIAKQKKHHAKKSTVSEYIRMVKSAGQEDVRDFTPKFSIEIE